MSDAEGVGTVPVVQEQKQLPELQDVDYDVDENEPIDEEVVPVRRSLTGKIILSSPRRSHSEATRHASGLSAHGSSGAPRVETMSSNPPTHQRSRTMTSTDINEVTDEVQRSGGARGVQRVGSGAALKVSSLLESLSETRAKLTKAVVEQQYSSCEFLRQQLQQQRKTLEVLAVMEEVKGGPKAEEILRMEDERNRRWNLNVATILTGGEAAPAPTTTSTAPGKPSPPPSGAGSDAPEAQEEAKTPAPLSPDTVPAEPQKEAPGRDQNAAAVQQANAADHPEQSTSPSQPSDGAQTGAPASTEPPPQDASNTAPSTPPLEGRSKKGEKRNHHYLQWQADNELLDELVARLQREVASDMKDGASVSSPGLSSRTVEDGRGPWKSSFFKVMNYDPDKSAVDKSPWFQSRVRYLRQKYKWVLLWAEYYQRHEQWAARYLHRQSTRIRRAITQAGGAAGLTDDIVDGMARRNLAPASPYSEHWHDVSWSLAQLMSWVRTDSDEKFRPYVSIPSKELAMYLFNSAEMGAAVRNAASARLQALLDGSAELKSVVGNRAEDEVRSTVVTDLGDDGDANAAWGLFDMVRERIRIAREREAHEARKNASGDASASAVPNKDKLEHTRISVDFLPLGLRKSGRDSSGGEELTLEAFARRLPAYDQSQDSKGKPTRPVVCHVSEDFAGPYMTETRSMHNMLRQARLLGTVAEDYQSLFQALCTSASAASQLVELRNRIRVYLNSKFKYEVSAHIPRRYDHDIGEDTTRTHDPHQQPGAEFSFFHGDLAVPEPGLLKSAAAADANAPPAEAEGTGGAKSPTVAAAKRASSVSHIHDHTYGAAHRAAQPKTSSSNVLALSGPTSTSITQAIEAGEDNNLVRPGTSTLDFFALYAKQRAAQRNAAKVPVSLSATSPSLPAVSPSPQLTSSPANRPITPRTLASPRTTRRPGSDGTPVLVSPASGRVLALYSLGKQRNRTRVDARDAILRSQHRGPLSVQDQRAIAIARSELGRHGARKSTLASDQVWDLYHAAFLGPSLSEDFRGLLGDGTCKKMTSRGWTTKHSHLLPQEWGVVPGKNAAHDGVVMAKGQLASGGAGKRSGKQSLRSAGKSKAGEDMVITDLRQKIVSWLQLATVLKGSFLTQGVQVATNGASSPERKDEPPAFSGKDSGDAEESGPGLSVKPATHDTLLFSDTVAQYPMYLLDSAHKKDIISSLRYIWGSGYGMMGSRLVSETRSSSARLLPRVTPASRYARSPGPRSPTRQPVRSPTRDTVRTQRTRPKGSIFERLSVPKSTREKFVSRGHSVAGTGSRSARRRTPTRPSPAATGRGAGSSAKPKGGDRGATRSVDFAAYMRQKGGRGMSSSTRPKPAARSSRPPAAPSTDQRTSTAADTSLPASVKTREQVYAHYSAMFEGAAQDDDTSSEDEGGRQPGESPAVLAEQRTPQQPAVRVAETPSPLTPEHPDDATPVTTQSRMEHCHELMKSLGMPIDWDLVQVLSGSNTPQVEAAGAQTRSQHLREFSLTTDLSDLAASATPASAEELKALAALDAAGPSEPTQPADPLRSEASQDPFDLFVPKNEAGVALEGVAVRDTLDGVQADPLDLGPSPVGGDAVPQPTTTTTTTTATTATTATQSQPEPSPVGGDRVPPSSDAQRRDSIDPSPSETTRHITDDDEDTSDDDSDVNYEALMAAGGGAVGAMDSGYEESDLGGLESAVDHTDASAGPNTGAEPATPAFGEQDPPVPGDLGRVVASGPVSDPDAIQVDLGRRGSLTAGLGVGVGVPVGRRGSRSDLPALTVPPPADTPHGTRTTRISTREIETAGVVDGEAVSVTKVTRVMSSPHGGSDVSSFAPSAADAGATEEPVGVSPEPESTVKPATTTTTTTTTTTATMEPADTTSAGPTTTSTTTTTTHKRPAGAGMSIDDLLFSDEAHLEEPAQGESKTTTGSSAPSHNPDSLLGLGGDGDGLDDDGGLDMDGLDMDMDVLKDLGLVDESSLGPSVQPTTPAKQESEPDINAILKDIHGGAAAGDGEEMTLDDVLASTRNTGALDLLASDDEELGGDDSSHGEFDDQDWEDLGLF